MTSARRPRNNGRVPAALGTEFVYFLVAAAAAAVLGRMAAT